MKIHILFCHGVLLSWSDMAVEQSTSKQPASHMEVNNLINFIPLLCLVIIKGWGQVVA
jgi:hypothetical protein